EDVPDPVDDAGRPERGDGDAQRGAGRSGEQEDGRAGGSLRESGRQAGVRGHAEAAGTQHGGRGAARVIDAKTDHSVDLWIEPDGTRCRLSELVEAPKFNVLLLRSRDIVRAPRPH